MDSNLRGLSGNEGSGEESLSANSDSSPTTAKPKLTASEQHACNALLMALSPLRDLRGVMPLPYATTFLTIALDEGRTVNAYARAMGVNRFVMERHVRGIADRSRNGGVGLGLVTITRDPKYVRRRQVFLSDKGRALAKQMFAQIL